MGKWSTEGEKIAFGWSRILRLRIFGFSWILRPKGNNLWGNVTMIEAIQIILRIRGCVFQMTDVGRLPLPFVGLLGEGFTTSPINKSTFQSMGGGQNRKLNWAALYCPSLKTQPCIHPHQRLIVHLIFFMEWIFQCLYSKIIKVKIQKPKRPRAIF